MISLKFWGIIGHICEDWSNGVENTYFMDPSLTQMMITISDTYINAEIHLLISSLRKGNKTCYVVCPSTSKTVLKLRRPDRAFQNTVSFTTNPLSNACWTKILFLGFPIYIIAWLKFLQKYSSHLISYHFINKEKLFLEGLFVTYHRIANNSSLNMHFWKLFTKKDYFFFNLLCFLPISYQNITGHLKYQKVLFKSFSA